MLNGSALQYWDNNTCGLDNANTVKFYVTLKAAELPGQVRIVGVKDLADRE